MIRRLFLTLTAFALAVPAFAEVPMGDDGLHKPGWLRDTFLDLGEDLAEANDQGKRLMVLVEQRGCIYCNKMHEEVFIQPEIEKAIEDGFFVVQLNMFGDREVTDLDGTTLPEKEMVRRWGMMFTPTLMFLPEEVPEGNVTAAGSAVATMPGAFGKHTTLNLLRYVSEKGYETDEPFQKYHARLLQEDGVVE